MGHLAVEHPSLWIDESANVEFPELNENISTEILVVGAGIAGLSAALSLFEQGHEITIIEAGKISSGATGFSTAKVTALHGAIYSQLIKSYDRETAQLYAQANLSAVEKVARNVETYDIDCGFARGTSYTFTQESRYIDTIRAENDACRTAELSSELVMNSPLPFRWDAAVMLPNQAYFNPYAYCLRIAEVLRQGGVDIFERTRAQKLEHDENTVSVITDDVTITAEHVVIASHIPYVDDGMFFAKMTPHRSYAIAVELADPDMVANSMCINIDESTHSTRPTTTNKTVFGGGGHRVGETPEKNPYVEIDSWVSANFGEHVWTHSWSTQDYMSPDHLPYIGKLTSDHNNVWVATGFSKWGMTNGTVAGEIIADQIAGRENPYAHVFDPTRTNLVRSIKKETIHNAQTAHHYVGDKAKGFASNISYEAINSGEGALVNDKGKIVAAYRGDDGALTCLSSRCTHMGCTVIFNQLEKSWDCPCHGSRFDTDGVVIDGPASSNLEKIQP